jgi:hypothetical protein
MAPTPIAVGRLLYELGKLMPHDLELAHIANAMIVKRVQAICVQNGFSCPVVCTPEELMER